MTQKLVESGSPPKEAVTRTTEALPAGIDKEKLDVEQILSVPNYIYFEEHYPTESYKYNSDERGELKEIKLSDLIEEQKNEVLKIGKRFKSDELREDDMAEQENVRPFGPNSTIRDFNSVIGHNSQMC